MSERRLRQVGAMGAGDRNDQQAAPAVRRRTADAFIARSNPIAFPLTCPLSFLFSCIFFLRSRVSEVASRVAHAAIRLASKDARSSRYCVGLRRWNLTPVRLDHSYDTGR